MKEPCASCGDHAILQTQVPTQDHRYSESLARNARRSNISTHIVHASLCIDYSGYEDTLFHTFYHPQLSCLAGPQDPYAVQPTGHHPSPMHVCLQQCVQEQVPMQAPAPPPKIPCSRGKDAHILLCWTNSSCIEQPFMHTMWDCNELSTCTLCVHHMHKGRSQMLPSSRPAPCNPC